MKTIYIHAALNFDGGIGSVVKNLIYEQKRDGNEVYLCGIQGELIKKIAADYECKFFIFSKHKFVHNVVAGFNLKKIYNNIKKNNLKCRIILICHSFGILGMLGKCPKNTYVVLHGHIYDDNSLKTVLFYKLLFRKLKRKCVFIACSNECANYFKKKFNLNTNVVQNGIMKKSDCSHKLSKDRFRIGYIGTMDNHKGYKFLINSIPFLNDLKKSIDFIFVGMNNDNFDFSNLNNAYINVNYLGVVEDLSNKIFDMFDLIVLPSLMEGLPMSLLEGISYGIPILATQVGGIPEILIDDYNGYFIKRDGKDIADKIKRCLDDEKYILLSNGCKHVYENGFSSEIMYNNYENIFDEGEGSNKWN